MSRAVCGICWCPYDEDTGDCACPPANVQKSTLREAAQQALEALESCDAAHPSDGGRQWYDDKLVEPAITALRAALAEPQLAPAPGYCKHCKQYTIEEPLPAEPVQEPVAWRQPNWSRRDGAYLYYDADDKPLTNAQPLYAAPPQRKPLTDEQLLEILADIDADTKRLPPGLKAFARAIEQAHGITGESK